MDGEHHQGKKIISKEYRPTNRIKAPLQSINICFLILDDAKHFLQQKLFFSPKSKVPRRGHFLVGVWKHISKVIYSRDKYAGIKLSITIT